MIIDIKESNKKIIDLIKSKETFSISRLGDIESLLTIEYVITNNINKNLSLYNAGIYTKNNDEDKIKLWCKKYHECIVKSNYLASFENLYVESQNFYKDNFNIKQIHSRSIEPYYVLLDNEIPWTHYLVNKKILIINPFVESFKEQIKNGFEIFKDNRKVFLPNQEFVFYKSFQTIAGNNIHNDWYETFEIMCNDIKTLDFDIALLGCGGYGLPLCNFIKNDLNKSCIYIGGGLQLLFGVMGDRWKNNEMWKKIIEENDCKFIRPSKHEICNNFKNIENGCYW